MDYGDGVTRRLDTVVRQNLLYGIKKANIEYSKKVAEEIGADGYEIDVHNNSRPSHLFMEGKQYCTGKSRKIDGVYFVGFEEVDPDSPDGLSAKEALDDYGCLHYATPIICGVSEPSYTKKQLQEIKSDNAKIYEIDGKKGNGYFWSQKMRRLETEVRKTKDEINALKALGNSEQQIKDLRERAKAFQAKYDEISEVTGIAKEPKRLAVSVLRYSKPSINVEEVYRQAKNQVKHAGIYNDAFNKSQARLNKSINSHLLQVDEHLDKLNNPQSYDVGWNNKTAKQKQGLLRKWQKDMIRNAEQAEIERRIFNERFGNK